MTRSEDNSNFGFAHLLLLLIVVGIITVLLFLIKDKTNRITKKNIYSNRYTQLENADAKWVLRRQVNGEEETIFSLYRYSEPDIQIWENWLFWVENHDIVYAYNINTGERKKVFEEQGNKGNFVFLKIIGSELFISLDPEVPSDTIMGALYWIDLPPAGNVSQVHESIGGRFEDYQGLNFLVNRYGDSCVGSAKFYLFNPVSKTVNHIVDLLTGCVDGDEFIGVNSDNEIILANHSNQTPFTVEKQDLDYYKSIKTISLSNPGSEKVLVDSEEIPKNIIDIHYDEITDRLYIVTYTNNFIYDFTEGILKEVKESNAPTRTPTTPPQEKQKLFVDHVFDKIENLDLPEDYKFTLE